MHIKVYLLQSFSMFLVQMSLLQWFQPSGPRVTTVHVGSPLVSCPTTKNIAQQCARSPLWSWWRYCRAAWPEQQSRAMFNVGSAWPDSRPGPLLASLIISSCSSSAPTELSSSADTESRSAEKDKDAIARCLVASRGWDVEIVAFLSTHSGANTKFKFDFCQVLRLKSVTLISISWFF